MNTTIDKSEINQKELVRYGIDVLDTSSITKFKLLLDRRIDLRDSDYTTMSDSDWIKHLRNSLVEMLNDRDNNKSL
jgi:hypothetical protein